MPHDAFRQEDMVPESDDEGWTSLPSANLQEESLICTNDTVPLTTLVCGKERREGRIKGTMGKKAASFLPRTGVLRLVGGVTLPPWKLAWASFIPH